MEATSFFGLHLDPFSLGSRTLALLLAAGLAGLIGLEREWHGHPAGMRTHILVCVGSALMTLTSVEFGLGPAGLPKGDPGRLAAQIITGIGFLGAGAIVRDGGSVYGLTTAASIWATAAIGITVGASPRMGELAVIATLLVLGTLTLLNRLEDGLRLKGRVRNITVEVAEEDQGPSRVLHLLEAQGIVVYSVHAESTSVKETAGRIRVMRLRVGLPRDFERARLNRALMECPDVRAYQLD